jgi:Uma2 family endonuclease
MPFPTETLLLVSDALLMALSSANPGLKMERHSEGRLIVMSPSGSNVSKLLLTIASLLFNWNRKSKTGVVFDP